MGRHRRIIFVSILALITAISFSCVNTRHLKEGEYLLYNQKIKAKEVHTSDLQSFQRQLPNRKILGLPLMPYLSAYYLGNPKKYIPRAERKREKANKRFDRKISRKPQKEPKHQKTLEKRLAKADLLENEGPSLKRAFGEPPVIYSQDLADESARQMSIYLRKKGYFDNEISLKLDTSRRIIRTKYNVKEGLRTSIRKVHFEYSEEEMQNVINASEVKHFLQDEDAYDEFLIRKELDLLEETFQNFGYFRFKENFIQVVVNDTFDDSQVDLHFRVIPPKNSPASKRYKLAGVNVITDASIKLPEVNRDTVRYKGINYIHFKPYVKLKQLDQKINIYPKQYYSYSSTIKTQRNLSNLNMYKYANLRYDSADNGFQAYIVASPLEKHTTSFEAGVAVTQWLPGPFGNLSFRTRNVFKGAEILELNLLGAIEAQTSFASETNFYSSAEAGVNTALTFPNIAFPSKFRFKFNDLNPKTTLSLGYLYTVRPEYARTNLSSFLRYSFSPKQLSTWNIKILDHAIISTDIRDPRFGQYLLDLQENGNNLIYSFGNSIVTSMSAEYVYNDFRINQRKRAKYYNFFFESGGTVWNLFDESNFEQEDSIFGLQYYKYLKGRVDYRKYIPAARNSTVAFRINGGLAVPYGINEALPYEKYFFAGGSNTLRAWQPRRLGPGAFAVRNEEGQISYQFEQPGEIQLLANIEYRFGIYRFIKGALYIDAGNVWRIYPNPTQPGGDFELNRFYKEIAVGAGYGIRLDFSFLLLRFDAGFKIYDPALPEGDRIVAGDLSNYDPLNQNRTLWNIGIGYPF